VCCEALFCLQILGDAEEERRREEGDKEDIEKKFVSRKEENAHLAELVLLMTRARDGEICVWVVEEVP
jgi:hypothetical protein